MPRLQESSETFARATALLTRGWRAWPVAGSLLLAAVTVAAAPGASDHPSRPVRIIVNVAPGGGVDTATRIVAQRLAERMGQPFVVENRASASGNVGAEAVFHAVPDGYTLLSSSGSPLAINGWIYKKLNYDPAGFEPVAIMSRIPNVLVVRNDFPAATVKDFIDYAKAHPGKMSYASQGSGTASHLTAELFMALTKTSLVHVPYKGTSGVMSDLVGNHVSAMFVPTHVALPLAADKQIRILGVASAERVPAAPRSEERRVGKECRSRRWRNQHANKSEI